MVDVSKALQAALQQLRTERALLDRQIAALERAYGGGGGQVSLVSPPQLAPFRLNEHDQRGR